MFTVVGGFNVVWGGGHTGVFTGVYCCPKGLPLFGGYLSFPLLYVVAQRPPSRP